MTDDSVVTTDDRVRKLVPAEEFDVFLRLVLEAANELEAIYADQYPSRGEQAVQARRYARDMQLVSSLREMACVLNEGEV